MPDNGSTTVPEGLRLITIHPSHYCEKARWALDLLGYPYKEEGYCPGLHVKAVASAAGEAYHSAPVLVVQEGREVLTDSSDIISWVHAQNPNLHLLPDSPFITSNAVRAPKLDDPESLTASSLQRYFDEELGPHTRRVIYFELLKYPTLFVGTGMALPQVPWYVSGIATAVFPVVRYIWGNGFMQMNEVETKKSMERVREVFAEVGALFQDGRKYLTGNVFTAADLTFAALAAPMVLPPEYGAPVVPKLEDFPEGSASRDLIQEMRATEAGQFVFRIYRDHRPAKKL